MSRMSHRLAAARCRGHFEQGATGMGDSYNQHGVVELIEVLQWDCLASGTQGLEVRTARLV